MKRKESQWRERRAEVQAAVGKLGRAHGLVKVDQRRTINGQRVGTVSESLCIAKINIPTPCQETIQTTNSPPQKRKWAGLTNYYFTFFNNKGDVISS